MADVQPLRALHYDPAVAGDFADLVAPPYDVIDAEQRAELSARSPYNVVEVDLPQGDGDPYEHAARRFATWRERGAVVRDDEPAIIRRGQDALAEAELLIADGHHRYETARAYAEEIGGEGAHRYVLACLVALEDPGLTVFPTHRLVKETTSAQQEGLADVLRR